MSRLYAKIVSDTSVKTVTKTGRKELTAELFYKTTTGYKEAATVTLRWTKDKVVPSCYVTIADEIREDS